MAVDNPESSQRTHIVHGTWATENTFLREEAVLCCALNQQQGGIKTAPAMALVFDAASLEAGAAFDSAG